MTKSEYQIYLQSDHWQAFRRKVYTQIKECAACESKKRLNIHHRNYNCLHYETLKDVVVLCKACHGYLHQSVKMGMSQKRWLKLHCPKLFKNKTKKAKKQAGILAVPQKMQLPNRDFTPKGDKPKKRKGGFILNQTMDLAEWRATHPNAR